MLEILFETQMTTLNDYINAERTDRYIAASIKKRITNSCMVESLNHRGIIDPNGLYDVEAYWQTKDNRKDPDNIYFSIKFILDGIVKAGVLSGDGRKNIRNNCHYIETTGKDCVKIILKKV